MELGIPTCHKAFLRFHRHAQYKLFRRYVPLAILRFTEFGIRKRVCEGGVSGHTRSHRIAGPRRGSKHDTSSFEHLRKAKRVHNVVGALLVHKHFVVLYLCSGVNLERQILSSWLRLTGL